jgi:putative membrane protein
MSHKLIISLILTGLAVVFVIQNVEVVEIHFLFLTFAMSRSLFMIFLLLIGILVGWLLHSYYLYRTAKK